MKMSWSLMLIIASVATSASGHGRVMDPVSRASAWRKGFGTEPNYDDDGLNCGGMAHQWSANGGRCGICGDAYDMPSPRPHEIGGKYGDGVIVAAFNPGSIISTAVQLTASHRGFWEFKICPDPEINNQGCFNKYPLELEDGGTRFYPTQGARTYHVNYRLPQGLKCEHCVLQWRYTAGNNWGVCQNGTQGLGCGNQEQFGACSDIAIGDGTRPQQPRPQQDPTAPQRPHYIPVIPPQPQRPKPQNHPNNIQPQTRPQKFPIYPQSPPKNPVYPQSPPKNPVYPQSPPKNPVYPQSPPKNPSYPPKNPNQIQPNINQQVNPNHSKDRPPSKPTYSVIKPYQNPSYSLSRPSQNPGYSQRPPNIPIRPKPLPPGLREFLRHNSANALKFHKGKGGKGSKKQRINSKKPKIPTYLKGAIKVYPAIKTYYQRYPELFNPYIYD